MGLDVIERRFGEGSVSTLLKGMFEPTLIGADVSLPGCNEIIEKENRRREEEQKRLSGIRGLVDRFFREEELAEREDRMPSPEKTVKKTLSDWLGKMSEKYRINRENDN